MLWLGVTVAGVLLESDLMTNVRLPRYKKTLAHPAAQPKRSADIAVAQIPFVFALGAKNSLTVLLGKGYEKVRLRRHVVRSASR
jgi:hypothetical protein